ncbi:MAG: DNRLRE domain-containing protein, partial [Candidatus Nanoarchaeia archaeon]
SLVQLEMMYYCKMLCEGDLVLERKCMSIGFLAFCLGILLTPITFVPQVHAQGGTIILNPTDDAYTDGYNVNSNYGSEPELRTLGFGRYLTWLKFDLSSIPEGVIGITAVLELYTIYSGVSDPHNVVASLILNNFNNSWTEDTITASNHPPYPDDVELDTEYVANDETWYEWIVTEAIVNATANNATAVTILMRYPWGIQTPAISFNSKEGSLTKIPKLTVTWTALADTTPPTIGTPIREPIGDVDQGQNVKISVDITDVGNGVKNATLSYTTNNGTSWETPRIMTYNSATGYYEVIIPGQPADTWVKYRITAYDNAGNPYTEDNNGEHYVYTIIPEFPVILVLPLFIFFSLIAVVLAKKIRCKVIAKTP